MPDDVRRPPANPLRPSRRSVVGAAWAAPVIVAAGTAPATASSTVPPSGPGLVILYSALEVAGGSLYFGTELRNDAQVPTSQLNAIVVVTAPSADSWGAAPSARPTGAFAGEATTAARWIATSVSGTGDTRTFLFDGVTELAPMESTYFDFEIRTDGGAIGPGTLVRSLHPGGSGTAAQRTDDYAAGVRSTAARRR